MITNKTINFLSPHEHEFVEWYGKKRPFEDYWESSGGMELHHYIFALGNNHYHISFSNRSTITLSKIINMIKGREKDIYKGYSMKACFVVLYKVEEKA